jgi:hypothetical protein
VEPVGACAGVSDRFDLARCQTAPCNLNGQIKRQEPALVSGQIYSLSPLFFSLKKDMVRSQVPQQVSMHHPANKIVFHDNITEPWKK